MTGVQTCALPIYLFWGKENPLIYHDNFLINAFHHKNVFDRKELGIRDDVIIFGDSGGLQQLTTIQGKNMKLNPREIQDWQEQSCNIGFCLDKIPYSGSTIQVKGSLSDQLTMKCAEETKRNIDMALKYKDSKDFKLYGIIQGKDYKSYKKWYDIIKDDNLSGYAVKGVNSPMSMAVPLLFAYENLDRPIHMLGVGGLTKLAIPIYFSNFFKYPITCDTTITLTGIKYRLYYLPAILNENITYQSNREKVKLEGFPCDCPACKSIDFKTIFTHNRINEVKFRSEERRVGKECRSRWSPYH